MANTHCLKSLLLTMYYLGLGCLLKACELLVLTLLPLKESFKK